MSTTVQAILEGAYNRSSANDAGKLSTDGELIAHLSRIYTRLFATVGRARPDLFAATASVSLIGVPPAGSVPADTVDVLGVRTSAGVRVNVVAMPDVDRSWQLAPCVLRRGQQLVSRNLGGDPRAGDVLVLEVLDAPPALTALTSTLDPRWPLAHVQLLVDALAVYLAIKDAGRPAGERQQIAAELAQSAAALASAYGLPPGALEWLHAPAERSGGKAA